MEILFKCLVCHSKNYKSFIETAAMMHDHLPQKYNFDRCEECGLVFLNPRIEESELGEFYTAAYLPYRVEEAWGRYAPFVKKDQRNIDKARVKRLKKHHNLTPVSRVLDVGCGKPTFLSALYHETPAQLIGLDFSDEGWKNDIDGYQGIDLRVGEIKDLKDEIPIDVITMWHYLEHDYQPQQHLKELLNLTHPQTKLIIEVPNFDSFTRRKFGAHWAGYHTPRHTALYSPNNIEVLLENSGWQVELVYLYGTLHPYTLHWMSKMEKEGIDWYSSMESRFVKFVMGMLLNAPFYSFEKILSMGFMTVIAKPV